MKDRISLTIYKKNGFSLIELIIYISISALVLVFVSSLYIFSFKKITDYKSHLEVNSVQSKIQDELDNICSWANTINDTANSSITCVANRSCTSPSGALLQLRDSNNQVFFDSSTATMGFDKQGRACNNFSSTTGNDSCPYKYNLNWKIICPGGGMSCPLPLMEVTADLLYSPNNKETPINTLSRSIKVTKNLPIVRKNCKQIFDAGVTKDGIYYVDPDGPGGSCPFSVYCDMSNHGGGWTLLANAPKTKYTEIPIVSPPLQKNNLGRLSDNLIQQLLSASGNTTTNNLLVQVHNPSGDIHYISMRTLGASSQQNYPVNDSNCTQYDTGPNNRSSLSGSVWGFYSGSGSNYIGIKFNGPSGFDGFSCKSCAVPILACGLGLSGCCEDHLEGSLWVR